MNPIRDYIRSLPLPNVCALRQTMVADAKHLQMQANALRFGRRETRDMRAANELLALAGQSQSIASVANKVIHARTDKRRAWAQSKGE